MTTKGQNYAFITPDESENDNENLSEENKLNENSEEDEWLTIKNFIQSLMQGKIMPTIFQFQQFKINIFQFQLIIYQFFFNASPAFDFFGLPRLRDG